MKQVLVRPSKKIGSRCQEWVYFTTEVLFRNLHGEKNAIFLPVILSSCCEPDPIIGNTIGELDQLSKAV